MQTQLKAICRQVLGLIALLLFSGATPVLAAVSQAKGKEPTLAQKPAAAECEELLGYHWEALKKAESQETDDEEYWPDLLWQTREQFDEMVKVASRQGKIKEFCDCYVSQFGKSIETDMRWLLPVGVEAFPPGVASSIASSATAPEGSNELHKEVIKLYELCSAMSEALVRRLLKEPELLERYYRIVDWSWRLIGSGERREFRFGIAYGITLKGLNNSTPNDLEYWFYARDAMLLMVATDRQDMLQGVEPTELKAVFNRWNDWYLLHREYLTADQERYRWTLNTKALESGKVLADPMPSIQAPETPFKDWKWKDARKPITPRQYIENSPY